MFSQARFPVESEMRNLSTGQIPRGYAVAIADVLRHCGLLTHLLPWFKHHLSRRISRVPGGERSGQFVSYWGIEGLHAITYGR